MMAEKVPLVGYRDPARNQTLVPIEFRESASELARAHMAQWNGKVYRWHRGRL